MINKQINLTYDVCAARRTTVVSQNLVHFLGRFCFNGRVRHMLVSS